MRGKQKLGITCSLATVLSLGLTMNASATIITDQLYNTGLNATGDALPANGGVDANWSVSPGSNAVTYKHRLYAANSTTSMWISSNSSGGNETTSSAEYLFSTSFDLSGYDPVSAQITGLWGVDNYATIFLNNNATGVSLAFGYDAFRNLHDFTVAGGFIEGINTLTVKVTNGYDNNPSREPGPMALRFDNLQLTANAVSVPEPGALALIALGLVSISVARHRQR